ncbi:HNH endonuclease [Flammeovirgaceae bacterium SG7u.111]|nr:HNH endonuclease [Flammeovirgaceae bacterium SG7u.132]WPO37286.1 HNH endonuclease [Flammeovirgaceae bacterium SG7u.111]
MANQNRDKKKKIFELFSQNLEWVKEHPSISFQPDFSNGYLCPLCFEVFYEKDLDSSLSNYLTLEDVPPKSLGGKPLTLTCKTCNSRSGHELDNHLLNRLLELDSHSFLPNSKTDTTFELNGNEVNGTVEVDKEGKLKLEVQTNRSNPIKAQKFNEDLIPPRTIYNPLFYPDKVFDNGFKTLPFSLKFKKTSNERRAEIALLRVAYLLAYSVLGNGFYINGALYKIREQILNPDKKIIPDVFWIKYEFPKQMEGINIITLPKELRCFLVIFRLETKSISRQFAIVLPGPSELGLKVYDYILSNLCVGDGTEFMNGTSEHIEEKDFLKNKDYAFASNWYWQEYTKEDYKPNFLPDEEK